MQNTAKSEKARRILHWFRHHSIWPLIAVIILVSFLGTLQFYYGREKTNAKERLERSMQTVLNRLQAENELVALYNRFNDTDSRIYLNVAAYIIERSGYSDEIMDWFNTDTADGFYCYVDADGNTHTKEGTYVPKLTDDRLDALRRGKTVSVDGCTIMGKKCLDGMIVTGWTTSIPDSITDRALFEERETGIIVQNTETGSYEKRMDRDGVFDEGGIRCIPESEWVSESGRTMVFGRFVPENGSGMSAMLHRGIYLSCDLKEGHTVILFSTITDIFSRSLVDTVIGYLLLIAFAILAGSSAMRIRRRVKESGTKEFKRISKRFYVHVPTFSRLVSLLLFSMLVFMSITAYMQVLRDYSVYCSDATADLDRVTKTIESDLEIRDDIQAKFETVMTDRAVDFADCINAMPQFMEDEELQVLADIWDAEEISVFNSRGVIVKTTGKYSGYSLSTVVEDAEYKCWELLNGDARSVVYPLSDGTDRYQVAVRRLDQTGFVRFTVSATQLNTLLRSISISSSVLSTEFSGSILYIEPGKTDTAYRFDDTASKGKTVDVTLSEASRANGFIGIRKVLGQLSCLVTSAGENGAFVSVMPLTEIAKDWLPLLMQSFVCYVIIALILLTGTGLFAGEEYDRLTGETAPKSAEEAKKDEDGVFLKGLLKRELYSAFLAIPLLLLLNHFISDNSILKFLISETWEKTFNVFSVTVIILMIIGAVCLCGMIRRLCDQISGNLDANTNTAARLISSILRVVIVVWVFVTSLYQVGVDMSTIIAGIGITTLALSLAAKDTVNDMIAGIFLVLDGNIHVGDYLEVDGFYGKVVDMNIRTVRLKFFNQVKSINNSAMQNVINCSRGTSCVWFSFCVTFDTDLERLKQLIEDNGEYFMRETEGQIQGPPVFMGVDETSINGLSCVLYAPVLEADRKPATRVTRTALINLLRKNGIELAHRYPMDMSDIAE